MEGGVLERLAELKGESLILERGNPACRTTVRREYRSGENSHTLNLKLVAKTPGPKLGLKYIYARDTVTVTP